MYSQHIPLEEQELETGSAWVTVSQNSHWLMDISIFTWSLRAGSKKIKNNETVIPNISSLLPALLMGTGPLTVHTNMGCKSPCEPAALGSPQGFAAHSVANCGQSQDLYTYTGFWCCWGVHAHLPETAWIPELLEEAEGGLRELSLGSRGEEQGRVTHMRKLCVLSACFGKSPDMSLFRNPLSWGTGHLLSTLPGWKSFLCFLKEKK